MRMPIFTIKECMISTCLFIVFQLPVDMFMNIKISVCPNEINIYYTCSCIPQRLLYAEPESSGITTPMKLTGSTTSQIYTHHTHYHIVLLISESYIWLAFLKCQHLWVDVLMTISPKRRENSLHTK